MPRTLFPALVATALLLGACGGVDSPPSAVEPAGSTPPAPVTSSAPAAEPTASPTPAATATRKPTKVKQHSGGKVAPSALPMARPDGSRGHLLAAATLPSYDADAAGSAWTVTATGPERTRPVGACQKATFVDIGALHAVRRGFAGPDGSGVKVRQVVARFADSKSAWRAHQVLRSWRDDCEEWLDHPHTEVGPMEDVKTDSGTAGAYRASYGTKKDPAASGLGIVRQGRWISVIALSQDGEDYPATWTRKAVRRIAATWG